MTGMRWPALLLLLAAAAAAAAHADAGTAAAAAHADAGTGAAAPACTLAPGRSLHEVEVVLGEVRRYRATVGPAAARAGRAPVLLLFHAWGDNPTEIERRLDPARHWPEAVVIAAEGLPRMLPEAGPRRRPGWQFVPGEYRNRDLAFFDALLEDVTLRYCIDPERITASGYSNGGDFVNLLGCLRGDRLAGIAPVSSGGPPEGLACTGPLPVLIQHGDDDRVVPLSTGLASFAHWASQNTCEAPPDDLPRGCVDAKACAAPTRFCLHLFGHGWPLGISERVADFLRAQRRAVHP